MEDITITGHMIPATGPGPEQPEKPGLQLVSDEPCNREIGLYMTCDDAYVNMNVVTRALGEAGIEHTCADDEPSVYVRQSQYDDAVKILQQYGHETF
jgi:hypothetical protein